MLNSLPSIRGGGGRKFNIQDLTPLVPCCVRPRGVVGGALDEEMSVQHQGLDMGIVLPGGRNAWMAAGRAVGCRGRRRGSGKAYTTR